MGGIIFVVLMFAVPAVVALNGMFGSDWAKVVRGETEDRVKYVRHEEAEAKPAPKPAAKPRKKEEPTSEGGAA